MVQPQIFIEEIMIVYNQKIKDGEQKIFIGEDAFPYEKEGILLVADGLGGRGGYPHTKVDKKILEKEGFFDLVFGDVFLPCPEDEEGKKEYEEFKEFVLDSFTEIFQTKDYYFTSSKTIRPSGYFASRLVVAILLHEIKYSPKCDKEQLFKDIYEATTEEAKEEIMARFSNELADRLREKLDKIAKKINLVVETSLSGAYLLPSTVCLTLVNEKEDKVDAVYVWAGDSRGYLWDKDGGLGQVTDDHEKDETMYNLVSLSREFKLESRFVSFDKPCVLFNATDGCYKCSCYASPLEMEMTFLNIFSNAENFDVASKEFCEEYKRIGRHDDSNTMALHLYGYVDEEGKEDYGKFQKAVKDRLLYIQDNIVAKLPDILTVNYAGAIEMIEERHDQIIFGNASKWIEIPEVKAFVTQMMKDAKYEPYLQALGGGDSTSSIDAKTAELKKKALEWFADNKDKLRDDLKSKSGEEFYQLLSEDAIKFSLVEILRNNVRGIIDIKEQLIALEEERSKVKNLEDAAAEKCTGRFWRVRNDDVKRAIWANQRHLLNKAEVEEIEENLAALEEENRELMAKSVIRDRLYDEYQKIYERKFRSTKL